MTDIEQSAASASAASSAAKPWPVPDSYGIDRFADDSSLRSLLPLYLDDDLHRHLLPVFSDLGPRLGGELDSLAAVSYTHLTLPTTRLVCRSRWSPYH